MIRVATERLVNSPAVGRMDFLFVIVERICHNAASLDSFVNSAKIQAPRYKDVERLACICDVFKKLPDRCDGEVFT